MQTTDILRYDALDWIQQTHIAAEGVLDEPMMLHIAHHGDPAARMALANRRDLPHPVRRLLTHDHNRWVRLLAEGGRVSYTGPVA